MVRRGSSMKFLVSPKENFSNTTISIKIQDSAETIFHLELPGGQNNLTGWYVCFTYLRKTQAQELNELLGAMPQLLEIQVDEDAHPTYLNVLYAMFQWTGEENHELQKQSSTENDIPNLYDLHQQLKHALFNFEVITSLNNEYYETIFPHPGQEKLPVHIPSNRFDKSPVQTGQVVLKKAHERDPKCIEYFINNYSHFQEYVISADPTTINVFSGLSKALVKLIKQENASLGIYISLVPDICTFIVKKELLLWFFLILHRWPFLFLLFDVVLLSFPTFFAYQHWLTGHPCPLLLGSPGSVIEKACRPTLASSGPEFMVMLLIWYFLLLLLLFFIFGQIMRKRWLYSQLLLPRLLGAAIVGLLPLVLNDQSWNIGI